MRASEFVVSAISMANNQLVWLSNHYFNRSIELEKAGKLKDADNHKIFSDTLRRMVGAGIFRWVDQSTLVGTGPVGIGEPLIGNKVPEFEIRFPDTKFIDIFPHCKIVDDPTRAEIERIQPESIVAGLDHDKRLTPTDFNPALRKKMGFRDDDNFPVLFLRQAKSKPWVPISCRFVGGRDLGCEMDFVVGG